MSLERRICFSKLDFTNRDSSISKSEFWGFLNLLYICVGVYLVAHPLTRFLQHEHSIDLTLAHLMFRGVVYLFLSWFTCYLWSFTAYLLHCMYLSESASRSTYILLQRLIELCIIVFPTLTCIEKSFTILPCGYLLIVATLFYMKIHSFSESILEYHNLKAHIAQQAPELFSKESYEKTMRLSKLRPDLKDYYDMSVRNYCSRAQQFLKEEDKKDNKVVLKMAIDKYMNSNPSLMQFTLYLMYPVLVYESSYPRSKIFSLMYFSRKLCEMVAEMIVLYYILTRYLIPITRWSTSVPLYRAVLELIWPYLVICILVFLIIFESICNLLAEITYFGDREFYQDWWNSTSWYEFSRKWNRPVYEFLARHVYKKALEEYKLTKSTAALATFVYSAFFHELIIATCFRVPRFWLSALMLFQLPLIKICRVYNGTKTGNCLFWLGTMIGIPILSILYGREYVTNTQI